MTNWSEGKKGRLFIPGKEAFGIAAEEAAACAHFGEDYEEECFCLPERSCYNCRYRRWTKESFECLKRR